MNDHLLIVLLALVAVSSAVHHPHLPSDDLQQRHFPEWVDKVRVSNAWSEEKNAVPVDAEVRLTIALKIRNADKLDAKFWSVSDPDNSDYGNYLTLSEVAEMISPLESDISMVRSWLAAHGVTQISTVVTKDYLNIVAPVSVVEKMFQVSLRYFKNINRKTGAALIRSTVPYSIPKHLSSAIDVVFGLTSFPASRPVIEMSKRTVQMKRPNVDPPTVKKTMHIGNFNGSGRADNIQAISDFDRQYINTGALASFFQAFNLPNNGGAGSEPFFEWIVAVNNQPVIPTVASVEYSDDELTFSMSYMTRANVEFAKAGIRGMTLLFVSGNLGAGCDYFCKAFVPTWPATSPYVTSVGGAQIETLSPFQASGFMASGGGFSNFFKMPKYQTQAVQTYLQSGNLPPSSFFNSTGRAVPDIAAFAHNIVILGAGFLTAVSGTVCAPPIAAGVLSLINEVLLDNGKPTLGFFNPLLYKIAASNPSTFYDVTTGSNPSHACCGGFSCAKGWDAVTGWGIPMFNELRDAVLKTLNIN